MTNKKQTGKNRRPQIAYDYFEAFVQSIPCDRWRLRYESVHGTQNAFLEAAHRDVNVSLNRRSMVIDHKRRIDYVVTFGLPGAEFMDGDLTTHDRKRSRKLWQMAGSKYCSHVSTSFETLETLFGEAYRRRKDE